MNMIAVKLSLCTAVGKVTLDGHF